MEDGSEDEDGDNAQHEDGGDGTEAELARLLQQPHQNQHHQQAVDDGQNGAVQQLCTEKSGMAQWVERPIKKPSALLTRVRVPSAAIDFFH